MLLKNNKNCKWHHIANIGNLIFLKKVYFFRTLHLEIKLINKYG